MRRIASDGHESCAMRALACSLSSALLSACTLAPRYEQPAAPVPAAYESVEPSRGRDAGGGDRLAANSFRIPSCRALIRARSPTTATCASRRSTSKRRARSTASERGSRAVDRCGRRGEQPAHAGVAVADRRERTRRARTPPASASRAFELDLFGRVRSLRRAALEDYFRLEENPHRRAIAAGVRSRQRVADADRRSRTARARAKERATASASPTT